MVLRFRTALFISVLSYTLTAQEKEATVSSLIQLDVIRQFETAINENYIIPDKRPILISGLEAAIKDGSFNQTMSIEDFVNLTNRIIQASFPDRHLGLLSPQKYDEISQLFSD
ncbi:MAG: hypothetical protein KDD94_15215, partial [Calditrichaeota bacterium]|nr:hypothetical protein [Calditrichota bacterium]